MTNCYIYYLTFIDKKMTHKKFVNLVVEDMIKAHCWIERQTEYYIEKVMNSDETAISPIPLKFTVLTIDATKFYLKNRQNRARCVKNVRKALEKEERVYMFVLFAMLLILRLCTFRVMMMMMTRRRVVIFHPFK